MRNLSVLASIILLERCNVSSGSGMGVYLCVHACVSGLSVVRALPVLHIHVSLSPSLHLSFFLFSLRLSHLFICRCLTVLIIALALAQHVLPKQDTEMEFEKEGVCGRL